MENNSACVRVQQVATTGTSWIICRSKTHNGRIYYFNTLTGEATWNLSESEIEKARRKMKKIFNEGLNTIGACPEPSEPPTDQQRESPTSNTQNNDPSTSNIPPSSTIYNKQIINNQFPKHQFPLSSFIVPGLNVVSNMVPSVVQNPMFPISMNTSDTGYNTNVWAVTPQQQLLFNRNLPLVTQRQPVNVQFTNQGQCLNVPFHNQIPMANMQYTSQGQPTNVPYNSQDIPPSGQNTSIPSSSCYQRRKSFNASPKYRNKNRLGMGQWEKRLQSNNVHLDKFDLRKVLSAKKMQKQKHQADNNEESEQSQNWNSSTLLEEPEEHDTNLEMSAHPQTPQAGQVDVDEDWIEEHFFIEEGKIKLDLTNLKKLATSNMDPHFWYIVADKDILLNHLNFLNIVCNSDEDCCLMVPKNVLSELQAAKEDSVLRVATRAKRAVVFLLQHPDGQNVVIGDANYKETGTRCDYLLNCCANLLEQNYHVVLLSNDEDFGTLKDNTQIPVFNIKELKQVLTNPELLTDKKKDRFRPPPCLNKNPIKNTVHNDLTSVANEEGLYGQNISIKINSDTPNQEILNQETETQKISVDIHALSISDSSKKQVTTNIIQSDVAENNKLISNNKSGFEACSKESLKCDDTHTTFSDNNKTALNNTKRQRPIRLNRSISVKTSASAEETPVSKDEKKQFRWRKKRLANGNCSNDCKISSTASSNVEVNNADICHINEASSTSIMNPERREDMVSDESLLNDNFRRNTTNEKVIIEETSSSEIISNSESEYATQTTPLNLVTKRPPELKKVMFEVKNMQMEHSLQVMKDEWLSRFWQIMEEVLTQILRQDEKFLHEVVYQLHGGGPWTILEAIDCVKIKFKYFHDVLDAASELSTMISKISDSTGRIIVNVKPSEFMLLYSYGVHMLECLKPALGHCEDLATASQLLLKLLDDIKDPNLESSHNDTFSDLNLPDSSHRDTHLLDVAQSPTIQKSPVATPSRKKMPNDVQQSLSTGATEKRTYNLRSKFRTLEKSFKKKSEENTDQPVKFIRTINIQDSFFSSLNLVKKVTNNEESYHSPDTFNANTTCYQDLTASIFNEDENSSEPQPIASDAKVKVVREFKLCPEFEKTFKQVNKKPEERVPLDMDQLDYSEYHEKDDDYLAQNYLERSDQNFDRYEEVVDNEKLQEICLAETNVYTFLTNFDSGNFEYNSPLNVNYNLNCIFGRMVGDINESLVFFKTFCKNIGDELSGPVYLNKRKCELLKETKKAQAMINDLCKYLYNIYARETYEVNNNIQALLTEAGINDFDLDDNLLKAYREVINTCFKQAKILQDSVALLITAVINKPTTL